MQTPLISTQNLVESPFIIAKIGKYTFGHFGKEKNLGKTLVTYPNFLNSLSIKKVNGSVNTYSLQLIFAITRDDDPNMLEKVFSSVSDTREITLSYGDFNAPNYIYKDEVCVIKQITSNIDFEGSRINYTVQCVSKSLSLQAGLYNFPATTDKPSNVLRKLFDNKKLGLKDLFYGMKSDSIELYGLIPDDDKRVQLKAQVGVTVLAYINYLVSCMTSSDDSDDEALKKSVYYWSAYDDVKNIFGGPYIKVVKVANNSINTSVYNAYEVNVGYPSNSAIIGFSVNTNDTWSLLYKHAEDTEQPSYVYDIDDNGRISQTYSPSITSSSKYLETTSASRDWWSKMTNFPITATLTIKGLLRPTMLMSYVKVNTYFHGHKHISSGLYMITKQEDKIDSSGYRTTLSLTRISGDESA